MVLWSTQLPQKIFTERYDWISENGRRTLWAEEVLRKIAFSTSCLNGEEVAKAMHLPVSHDVLLSIIRKTDVHHYSASIWSMALYPVGKKTKRWASFIDSSISYHVWGRKTLTNLWNKTATTTKRKNGKEMEDD